MFNIANGKICLHKIPVGLRLDVGIKSMYHPCTKADRNMAKCHAFNKAYTTICCMLLPELGTSVRK